MLNFVLVAVGAVVGALAALAAVWAWVVKNWPMP